MKKYTKEQIIDEMVERRMDQFNFSDLESLLKEGWTGYDERTDRELLEHFLTYIVIPNDDLTEFLYVNCHGDTLKVEPVEPAGIKLDGVVDDYQYI